MIVNQTPDFVKNSSELQQAEKTVVNSWVFAMQQPNCQEPFTPAKEQSKEIKKLRGEPPVAKGGQYELVVGKVNRVFFKWDPDHSPVKEVTLTNVGHS